MAEMKSKVGYGEKDKVPQAIEGQQLDSGDIVFTSDTEEIGFIKPDGTVMYPTGRILVFESLSLAQEYTNSGSGTIYAGQLVKVKLDDGKYHSYTLQSSDSGGFILEEDSGGSAEEIEQAKQEAITESKNYVDSALTVVEFF